jgi:hypothetical protein
MATTEQRLTVTVDTQVQLVDLNKTYTNFSLAVSCTSTKPFYARIATQKEIDTVTPQGEKIVSGTFHKSLRVESNVYENYYLVLWADEQSTVNVAIQLEVLPDTSIPPSSEDDPSEAPTRPNTTDNDAPAASKTTTVTSTPSPRPSYVRWAVLAFLFVSLTFVLYTFVLPYLSNVLARRVSSPLTDGTPSAPPSVVIETTPTAPSQALPPLAPPEQSIIDTLNTLPL